MGADILDFLASFVVLLSILTFSVTATTETLDNLYLYHSSQQINTVATNFLNGLAENTGYPTNWAQSSGDPTSIGLRWAIADSSYLNPFVPMRMMYANDLISYNSFIYGDLSSTSLGQWSGANLYFNTADSVKYEEASLLVDTYDTYGWRLAYTPMYNIEVSTSTPSVIPWYAGWGYRMVLTINHSSVPITINDYPILISLEESALKLNARSDGADILFTTQDKLTKIPHEIEYFNGDLGVLEAWVRIPMLSDTVDTILYIYYGNPSAENQESPNLVWSDYDSVYHMMDYPDASHIIDSSLNNLTGTKRSDHEPTEVIDGTIAFAQDFDGSNDYIALDQSSLTSNVQVFELWLKSYRSTSLQTILSSGFKENSLGFFDVSRPPQTNATNGYDLLIDYATNSNWTQKASSPGVELSCMASFKGGLYAGSKDGRFFKWNGSNSWNSMPALPTPEVFSSLIVYQDKLYAGTDGGGKLFEWDEGYTSWILRAPTLKIKSLVLKPSDNQIYGGTDDGRLLRWNTTTNKWNTVAPRMGLEKAINALVIFGEDIYAGTSPGGKLYRWDGVASWVEVASPHVSNPFTDVVSLAVYGGKIYAGTSPGGYLVSWKTGSSWKFEETSGESAISALYTPKTTPVTQTFDYAMGGSTGGWTNSDNARLSDNLYLSHIPEIICSPTQYTGDVWTYPNNAYTSDGQYARTSTNGDQQTYGGYGTFTSSDPVAQVYIGVKGYGSYANQSLRVTVYDGTLWRTLTPEIVLPTTNPLQPIWVDITSLTAWTQARLNLIQTRVQFIQRGNLTQTAYLDWLPIMVKYSPASQVLSNFNVGFTGNSITKVEVGVEGYVSDASSDEALAVSVSSDNGLSWSNPQLMKLSRPSDINAETYIDFTYYTDWTTTLLDNSHLKVRITDVYSGDIYSSTFIDHINIRVSSNNALLYAATTPNTHLWALDGNEQWQKVIDSRYETEVAVNSIVALDNTIYGCTYPNGILVKQGTGGSSNKWVLAASPPATQKIMTMITDGTQIYGGTTPNGLLYKSTGSTWSQIASTQYGQETSILSLALDSSGANIKAGTNASGLLLSVPKSQTGGTWIKNADITLSSQTRIPSMTIYNGMLYLGTHPNGLLYEWDGVNAWIERSPQYPSQTSILSLTSHSGSLFGGTNTGSLLEWTNGDTIWERVAASLDAETSINALISYNNRLFGGTSPSGRLFEWDKFNRVWIGRTYILGAETTISCLIEFNGKLYGGTSPNGLLYEWDGATKWAKMADSLNSQKKITSLTTFNNKLYGTTQPDGYLFEYSDTGSRLIPNLFLGSEGKWMQLTVMTDYAQKSIDVYRNGTHLTNYLNSTTLVKPAKTPRYLGAFVVAGMEYNPYTGYFDELRISQTLKDENWVKLSYTNQQSPESMTEIGGQESIFFRVNVKVTSKDGPVDSATCGGTIIYSRPGAGTPEFAYLNSELATTDVRGEAVVEFRGFTSANDVYFMLMRASHLGIYGVSYHANNPSVEEDPFGVLVTDYDNGGLTIIHRKTIDASYPNAESVEYDATYAMPIGKYFYRQVTLEAEGVVSPSIPGYIQLGSAKEDPGVLLIFYKTSTGDYGVSYTPWGISALGLSAQFGAPIEDAINIVTKTRVANIDAFTYEVKLEFWKLGR